MEGRLAIVISMLSPNFDTPNSNPPFFVTELIVGVV
jgi:hypothetical protein